MACSRLSCCLALVISAFLSLSCGGGAARTETAPPVVAAPALPSIPDEDRFNLGKHSRAVSTTSAEAQRAFDDGLIQSFAFNHGAAERAFRHAAELDPQLAMAWWGVALVNGPHINNPMMSPEQIATAWDALGKARALAPKASAVEQALITALGARYSEDAATTRGPLDAAYANAMRELWKAHPADADIGALCAEALMDLHPWDLWAPNGDAKPGTDEILATLEAVLAIAPDHPLANHLYVHAVEGSTHPERGIGAADRLRTLVPGAGHLVHMPGHIDVRVGQWKAATEANLRAIDADVAWRKLNPQSPGFYALYMAHDHQFLAFSEMMRGRRASALEAARHMVAGVPPEFLAGPSAAFADGLLPLPIEVLVRFGRWEEVLAEGESPGGLPISKVKRLFARATALTALDRLDEADVERAAFREAAAALAPDAFVGNNSAAAIMAIASRVLDGEVAARRKQWDVAIASLREAATLEDQLRYDDPPDWLQPVRHSLGAVLVNAGRPVEAEATYREDLVRYPENGWSLFGLEMALRAQERTVDADTVHARFAAAWADADVLIGASCLCQQPKGWPQVRPLAPPPRLRRFGGGKRRLRLRPASPRE